MWWWLLGLLAAITFSLAFVPFGQGGVSLIDRWRPPRSPADREARF